MPELVLQQRDLVGGERDARVPAQPPLLHSLLLRSCNGETWADDVVSGVGKSCLSLFG